MIQRIFFSHHRGLTQTITAVVTVGAAILCGYLILWARL